MINSARLEEARSEILQRFVNKCQKGLQISDLPNDVSACGQYLDAGSRQRGLHGTAAALRVLSGSKDTEARSLSERIVSYLVSRTDIEVGLTTTNTEQVQRGIDRDNQNVIKVSEVLYALSFVDGSVKGREGLIGDLAEALRKGIIHGNGWDYFLDGSEKPELLPTAFAIRALAEHGYDEDIEGPAKFLQGFLKDPKEESWKSRADINVRANCLYVLTFSKGLDRLVDRSVLKKAMSALWRRLEQLLHEDFEQTIEYQCHDDHFYVRVPWQLYLLALASRLSPWKRFASGAAQRRLHAIVESAVAREGFSYPHSGDRLSSRTNAILYESLGILEENLRTPQALWPFYLVDRVRGFISRIVPYLALGAAGWVTVCWVRTGGTVSELGPELVGAFLLALIAAGKRP